MHCLHKNSYFTQNVGTAGPFDVRLHHATNTTTSLYSTSFSHSHKLATDLLLARALGIFQEGVGDPLEQERGHSLLEGQVALQGFHKPRLGWGGGGGGGRQEESNTI